MNTLQYFRSFPFSFNTVSTQRLFTLVALLAMLFTSACESDIPPAKATDSQSLYAQAKAEYDAKNYAAAKNDFINVIASNPDAVTKEKASYYLPLCYYYLLDYVNAKPIFEDFLVKFPASANFDATKYWLGRTELKLKNYQAALDNFNFVISRNTSVYVDNAAFQLGNVYYEWGVALLGNATPVLADTYAKFETAINEFDAFRANTNYATSSYIDDAAYFRARSLNRMAELLQLLNTTSSGICTSELNCYDQARSNYAWFDNDPTHPELNGSTYADSALYFSGRSYQVQTKANQTQTDADFALARTQFKKLVDSIDPVMLNSTLRDDAQYQYAMTYYDSAKTNVANILADPANETTATNNFINAINAFNVLLQSPGNLQSFVDNNRWDNALYFRGRSFERFTVMVEKSANPANAQTTLLAENANWSGPVTSVTPNATIPYSISTMYDATRAAFQGVLSFDLTSTYADNAQLEIGVMYQDQAGSGLLSAATASEKFTWLAQAEVAYTAVTSNGNCMNNPSCVNADNAAYNKAKVYDDTLKINLGELALPNPFNKAITYNLARSEFQNFVNTYTDNTGAINSIWVDNAFYHIADLRNTEGVSKKDLALLELALGDYANVILVDPTAQYVDNAIYHIGMLYHDYSPANDPLNATLPSSGCQLANDWLQTYVDVAGVAGALPTPTVANYKFSYPATTTVFPNTNVLVPVPLTTSQTLLDTAKVHLDAFAAAAAGTGSRDCGNVDSIYLSTTATIAPPTP